MWILTRKYIFNMNPSAFTIVWRGFVTVERLAQNHGVRYRVEFGVSFSPFIKKLYYSIFIWNALALKTPQNITRNYAFSHKTMDCVWLVMHKWSAISNALLLFWFVEPLHIFWHTQCCLSFDVMALRQGGLSFCCVCECIID